MVHVESISNGLWGKLRKRSKVGKETNKAILKPGDTIRVIGSRGTAKIRAILISVHGAPFGEADRRFPALESGRATNPSSLS
jgi:hypothetical protein